VKLRQLIDAIKATAKLRGVRLYSRYPNDNFVGLRTPEEHFRERLAPQCVRKAGPERFDVEVILDEFFHQVPERCRRRHTRAWDSKNPSLGRHHLPTRCAEHLCCLTRVFDLDDPVRKPRKRIRQAYRLLPGLKETP
jgi:hypothetical protein